ncbi:MAG: DUF423 domain-containing protein [Sinobacterium sp.]|nr:DUF423 domain-containing protein [Sinobacterium sp.]
MSYSLMIKFAALSGFLAVALGAFGAHGLKQHLSDDMMAVYQTAVQYQFIHTLALLLVALLLVQFPSVSLLRWAGIAFVAGILIFSGSLYVLSLSGIKWLGAITPIGGVGFLAGWILLLFAAFKLS